MRYILLIFFLFRFVPGMGQNFVTKDGEFMDTAADMRSACDTSSMILYYYQVHGKYPESSASLLQEATVFLAVKNDRYAGSGYITFRFTVDCTGNMLRKVQVIQTDDHYKDYHFDKRQVAGLYDFLRTLHKWNPARTRSGHYNYIAFLSFKIQNGKVINILP